MCILEQSTFLREKSMTKREPKVQATIGASTYVDPKQIEWSPSQFKGIEIKVLYENRENLRHLCRGTTSLRDVA